MDFRENDPRLGGRWWSIDPVVKPWESPYVGYSNNPIIFSDPSGLDPDDPSNDAGAGAAAGAGADAGAGIGAAGASSSGGGTTGNGGDKPSYTRSEEGGTSSDESDRFYQRGSSSSQASSVGTTNSAKDNDGGQGGTTGGNPLKVGQCVQVGNIGDIVVNSYSVGGAGKGGAEVELQFIPNDPNANYYVNWLQTFRTNSMGNSDGQIRLSVPVEYVDPWHDDPSFGKSPHFYDDAPSDMFDENSHGRYNFEDPPQRDFSPSGSVFMTLTLSMIIMSDGKYVPVKSFQYGFFIPANDRTQATPYPKLHVINFNNAPPFHKNAVKGLNDSPILYHVDKQ
jgi:hypothetical protein